MEDKTIVKVAAIGFIGLVVVPAVIGTGIKLVALTAYGISNLVHKHKIKKGLKDGSIIEIDGRYYEVELQSGEEA